jgi:hypothetical protein
LLTPQKIQELSDPIEHVYISMTNELLVNIGKHITSPTWTHTAAWEIQKLSELGQLTKENAAIINSWIAQLPDEIRDTMEETRRLALEDIEKQLAKAAKAGYVTPAMRDSTYEVLREYQQQAANNLNLVNTTMLQSSVAQYERLVELTDQEYGRLMAQREATQEALNEAAGNVAIGVETRTKALQHAIRKIADEGLTGFYDRAGRSWSPEAYVNMDIRTTVHNVAIQSVKNRMTDYNTQVFQVSAHAGARPLCYPYQGKLYSWDNTAGEIELGNGKTMRYNPLSSTSYGEPAGLFGINCGHSPIPIIPGVSIPHAQDFVQPKEENDKQYAESQEQRALERKIREAKRVVEMGDDSPEAKQRVRDAQKDMREFIDRTGRTRRFDREQLYGAKKAPTPPADQRQKPEKVNQQLTTIVPKDAFINVKGVDDDFKTGMVDVLEKSKSELAQKLFVKYADDLVCVNPNKKAGAYFSPIDRGVSMNTAKVAKGSDYEAPYEVAFHEFGHMIDWIGRNGFNYRSNIPIDGKSLLSIIKSDFQDFKKSVGVKRMADVIPILKKEQDALPDDKKKLVYGNVSDIIEGCTGIGYPLGIGHGASYHKRYGATEHEFFAEVLDAAVANPEGYAQMERIFPNAVNAVWKMVEGMI